jgi:hypothetical protein
MKSEKPEFESDADLAQVIFGHGPCTYLLLSLLFLIIIYPYCKDSGQIGRILLSIIYSIILIGGTYASSRSGRSIVFGVVLTIVGIGLQWIALETKTPLFFRLLCLVYIIFLVHTIGTVLRYLLTKGPVTADKLHGALAAYIMIAFLWAFIYSIIENFVPGSFNIPYTEITEPSLFYHLLYFSFTTLTTAGFGDITAITDQVRSLVIIEELAGVFFVAVLIARLAGLYPPRAE